MNSIYKKKQEIIHEQQEQERLRKKYDIEEKVIVKETSNMGKFLIKTCAIAIRVAASIVIAVLAATGLIALAYPEIRTVLIETVTNAFANLWE